MRLLSMRDVRAGFPGRDLFTVKQLDIYAGERLGLIGANGSGKSTLLRLMLGELEPLEGSVERWGDWQVFRQFGEGYAAEDLQGQVPDTELGIWGLTELWNRDPATLSGGEKTRSRLARILTVPGDILLLDEPTSHLDMEGIEYLSGLLWGLETFVLISHDRALLNEHCTRTLDIREGGINDYPGPYQEYLEWLEADLKRRESEYEAYQAEQARLTDVAQDLARRSHVVTKRPKGMSSSEAKQRDFVASRRSQGGKSKSLASQAKHTEKRLEQLEVKEKPRRAHVIRPDFDLTDPPQNRIIAEALELTICFPGQEPLFEDAVFRLKRNVRTALLGPNGSGKSVLLRRLVEQDPGIRSVPKAKYGFFRQEMELVNPARTILENIRDVSCQSETVDRSVLARMGFYSQDVHKQASVLSGGEQVKLSFAMLFVSDVNVLVLDEPTNFLDIPSLEAIEALLLDYEGTMLFVSHDRAFVEKLADEIWVIADKQVVVEKVAEV